MEQLRANPLKQYFRQFKMYLKLPSGISYYPPGVVTFTESGEVGIMAMTGKDELILKNPDALLNGEALVEVITSCVPAVKNPRALLTNDIDALITAVRYATYNDSLETELVCPACKSENNYRLDLQYSLDNMSYLESEYTVNLDSGLTVYVKPYGFSEVLKGLHAQFEQSKMTRVLENNRTTEEERMIIISKAFKEMATISYDLMLASVVKIVDESRGVDVNDPGFVRDFLHNTDKNSINLIGDLVKEINTIGIKKTFTAQCEKCNHQWESEIDFNPVNFS